MDLGACQDGVRTAFARPGKPTHNALVEFCLVNHRSVCKSEARNSVWIVSLWNLGPEIDAGRRRFVASLPRSLLVRQFGCFSKVLMIEGRGHTIDFTTCNTCLLRFMTPASNRDTYFARDTFRLVWL